MSIRAWLARRKIRSVFRPKMPPGTPDDVRLKNFSKALKAMEERLPGPPRGQCKIDKVDRSDGIKGEWITAKGAREDRIVLFAHGGGYTWGAPRPYRELGWRLSRACNARVFLLDYRLAPEHTCPAPIEDALRAYDWIIKKNPGLPVVLSGDSAGGGLTLATAHVIRDTGRPMPKALSLISPWLDLTGSGESIGVNADKDVMLDPDGIHYAADAYRGDLSAYDPRCSPLFGEQAGLPPVFLQVGDDEILLDDSVRFEARARSEGVAVKLDIWPKMHHVWHFSAMMIPEGRKAIADMAIFFESHFGN
ncbi:alpha/beta hydrolase [Kordiimonas aestuarii]|uniref:alpha/beta hydrolase n=1 Tax=Kordiimonas aestuarii TaxID=1005925 RepID=UPI0021D3D6DE|nr:alpha/beta hydrolase [Kordiimonas aestuarii]